MGGATGVTAVGAAHAVSSAALKVTLMNVTLFSWFEIPIYRHEAFMNAGN